jgi:undecaprenyl-diphosphatase
MTLAPTVGSDSTSISATRWRIIAHVLIWLTVSCGSFVGFLLVLDGVKDDKRPITASDHAILIWLHGQQTPALTYCAHLLADLGEPKFIVCIGLAAALVGYFARPVRGAAWTLPTAIVGAGILIQTVKLTFRRARPDIFTPLLHETGYSFPSGHSLISVVVYGLLGYFAIHLFNNRFARVGIGIATVLLVILIGLSRVYVGVHYPSDVLAGWSLGVPWLVGCLALHERLARHYSQLGEPVFPVRSS